MPPASVSDSASVSELRAGRSRRGGTPAKASQSDVIRAKVSLVSEKLSENGSGADALALDLTRVTGRFARVAGRVAGGGFSLIAWRVLAELEQAGPMRVSALAHQQHVAQPSMTGLVQRLEGEGWVNRAPDPADGRATLVSVTPAGVEALEEYRAAAAARVRPHLDALSDFDRATLARAAELMQQIGDGIDARPG
ncbi:MarR family transcriptional regulator [Leucobacter sp. Marseille-Q4368]|uniref:MarR family transcriptional regulator n=1 Tax=Leucobacter manosquensis TaxID=2810611 RepID=A0ABS5M829_9MICO|nr:MarR family transcriptional regulator [Leucobacter manosquensis]MBS3183116.1 MarR family transcriptional regulator [Leucobacter manosquensis]